MRKSCVSCLCLCLVRCPLYGGVLWGGLWEEQKEVLVPWRELWMLQFIGFAKGLYKIVGEKFAQLLNTRMANLAQGG